MIPPQIIHLIWLGNELPQTSAWPYRRFAAQWAELNPDWQVWLWRDQRNEEEQEWANSVDLRCKFVEELRLPSEEYRWVHEHIALRCWSVASDFLRLRILFEHGGMYSDCDVVSRKLPPAVLPLGAAMLLKKQAGCLAFVAPHVLVSVAGHPLWELALAEAIANCRLYVQVGEDSRRDERPALRFSAGLSLTGDLWRPALARIEGLLQFPEYRWTPGLDQLRLGLRFEHREDHSWVGGAKGLERFYAPTYMQRRHEEQRKRCAEPVMTMPELLRILEQRAP